MIDMDLLYMDAATYRAAANGEIEILMKREENLAVSLTPTKNTVLHINITAQTGGSGEFNKDYSIDFVEKVLDLCPSLLFQPNIKGETLLHLAARHGLDAVVETLLQRAKSHQDHDHYQELESGIDAASQMVRMINNHKETALHEAVRHHHVGVVQLLIRADPDFTYFANEAGETPLYLAVERGYHDLVFEILATCTSPAHGGPNGRKSLHAAVIFNDEEIIRKLIETKGSLTAEVDDQGWTPLHYAAHFGYAPVVSWLLQCDPSAAYTGDRDGKKTALHIAACQGHINVMSEILSCCPDCCELVDNRGRNLFHFALDSNSHRAVKFIIENSSLCNIIDEKKANERTSSSTSLRWLALEVAGGNNRSAPDIILSKAVFSGLKYTEDPTTERDIGLGERDIGEPNTSVDRSLNSKDIIANQLQYTEDPTGLGERDIGEPNTSDDRSLKDIIANQLIAATLIAAVTFTAGFTMPGGLSQEGPTQGAAVLIGSKAFKAFVITNTLAMGYSSSTVACHVFMERNRDNKPDPDLVKQLLQSTFIALTCMVLAFITGIYAVLEHSSAFGIGIVICVAGYLLIDLMGLFMIELVSDVKLFSTIAFVWKSRKQQTL